MNDQNRQGGFALLEVLVSVLLFTVGVIALIGLQASMKANASESRLRAEASYLANQMVGQIWVDAANLASYAIVSGTCSTAYNPCTKWAAQVAAQMPSGSSDISVSGAVVTITVRWQLPGGMPHNFQVQANVTS